MQEIRRVQKSIQKRSERGAGRKNTAQVCGTRHGISIKTHRQAQKATAGRNMHTQEQKLQLTRAINSIQPSAPFEGNSLQSSPFGKESWGKQKTCIAAV
jgi:hypothetical protein